MTSYRIALIPGDGIGAEVLPPAQALLDAVGRRHGLDFTYDAFDWSCQRYLAEGAMMPADGLRHIRAHDAVPLGATSSSSGRTWKANTEIGGRLGRGIPDELAVQEAVFTRKGATRVVEYAYTLAESRGNYGRHQCLIRGTTACGS